MKSETHSAMKLPCTLNEEGCFTTTLDLHAYVWDAPESCVVTQLFSQPARIMKHTPNFPSTIYFLVSDSTEHNDSSNTIKFHIRIKVFNQKEIQKNFTEQTSRTSSSHMTTVSIWILGTAGNLRVFHAALTDFLLNHNRISSIQV